MEGEGDTAVMEKKVKNSTSYFGFRLEGQGDLVSKLVMGIMKAIMWVTP